MLARQFNYSYSFLNLLPITSVDNEGLHISNLIGSQTFLGRRTSRLTEISTLTACGDVSRYIGFGSGSGDETNIRYRSAKLMT